MNLRIIFLQLFYFFIFIKIKKIKNRKLVYNLEDDISVPELSHEEIDNKTHGELIRILSWTIK